MTGSGGAGDQALATGLAMVYIMVYTMTKTAKIFKNGRSQAVRLPAEFRFPQGTEEVAIRRDEATGEVILSEPRSQKKSWAGFLALFPGDSMDLPPILTDEDRRDAPDEPQRVPFADWKE